jgi:hypothetical protein
MRACVPPTSAAIKGRFAAFDLGSGAPSTGASDRVTADDDV